VTLTPVGQHVEVLAVSGLKSGGIVVEILEHLEKGRTVDVRRKKVELDGVVDHGGHIALGQTISFFTSIPWLKCSSLF